MRFTKTILALSISMTCSTYATERFSEARIHQIETSDNNIVLFLTPVSGYTLPTGNGLTNEPVAKSMLLLANTAVDVANRRHLLASALAAHSMGVTLLFRWEDSGTNANRIVAMLQR